MTINIPELRRLLAKAGRVADGITVHVACRDSVPNQISALTVAAVNALPELLDEVERLRLAMGGLRNASHDAAMELWEGDRLQIEEPEPGDESFLPNHSAFSAARAIIWKHVKKAIEEKGNAKPDRQDA